MVMIQWWLGGLVGILRDLVRIVLAHHEGTRLGTLHLKPNANLVENQECLETHY
jgi:hypothetical protein